MRVCIIFAQAGNDSFNHLILNKVTDTCDKMGVDYTVRNLYQMNFNPVFSPPDMQNVESGQVSADIEEEQQVIIEADTLVMIYPVWWWSQPAILKGWIDRVFTNNFAFRYEAKGPVGLLTNKKAIVFTTTRESDAEMKQEGFDQVLKKQIADGVLTFSGFSPVLYRNFAKVPYLDNNGRQQVLDQVEKTIKGMVGQQLITS
ncbi:NAD(P)H-dependent oxidoreductase [Brevibacillus ginsengisoli]|uniref:NAD(P)H-dependent oxidoreductase n=1 Tax=Brevibacillus ginsengisoli TaxID=363854 RepID=UPI003CF2FC6B